MRSSGPIPWATCPPSMWCSWPRTLKCGFCTACFTGEYAVKPEEVLSTDIHERHLNDRPKNEEKS